MKKNIITWIATFALLLSSGSLLANDKVKEKTKTKTKITKDKINHDFDGVSIDGEVKAPNGFLIKGRTPQKLKQMVELRSNFNNNLRNSTSGVHSLAK